jgi:serine/threonine protein kinase
MSLLSNRYLILSELGRGGFGHTFLAEDTHLPSRRKCVIKQFKPANSDPNLLPHLQERFGREASILERVGEEHSQIPRLYAYFIEDEQFYLVQELIDGQTLGQIVRTTGPLKSGMVSDIVSSLLEILEFLHARDIIHRDIKPDNIIYRNRDNKPVLIDFGTVKETVTTIYDRGGVPTSLIIGSPGYMPMEQAAGLALYSSDLHALGWTAIYLLTGKQPSEMVDRRSGEYQWRQFVPRVDYHLATVIEKAVQRVSSDRYASAGEMLQALHPAPAETAPSPIPMPERVRPIPGPPTPPPQYSVPSQPGRPQYSAPSPPMPPNPAPYYPVHSQPMPPNPAPYYPVHSQPVHQNPAYSYPPVEGDYLLEQKDRWRIPLLFPLIGLFFCFLSLASARLGPGLFITWSLCGVAQGFLLRKYIKRVAWITATTMGAFAVLLLDTFFMRGAPAFASIGFLRIAAIVGIVGVAQWLVLLKYVESAKQWYLAGILAAILLFFAFTIESRGSDVISLKEVATNWLLAGLILGIAQAYILRHFRKKTVVPDANA